MCEGKSETGDKESTKVSLDISPLFFQFFKIAQALVITYDEIFQVLAAQADALPRGSSSTSALTVP
jgi:hypothetical protein